MTQNAVDMVVAWDKYPAAFARACQRTLVLEGKLGNNPKDRGGLTHFGITLATAKRHGLTLPFKRLVDAVEIYYEEYWRASGAIRFAPVSPGVAMELFDTGVLSGPGTAILLLQRAYNVLYTPKFTALKEDGGLGPLTVNAIMNILPRDEKVLLHGMNGEQYKLFCDIKEADQEQAEFIRGWVGKRLTIEL